MFTTYIKKKTEIPILTDPRSSVHSSKEHGRLCNVRLMQLLDCLSVASPESGLFSEWSRNKKVLRTEP